MWFCKEQTYVLNRYDGTIISFKSSRVKLILFPLAYGNFKIVLALLEWTNFRHFHLAFTTRIILLPQVKELMWACMNFQVCPLFFFLSPFQYVIAFKEMSTRCFCGSRGPTMNFSYSMSWLTGNDVSVVAVSVSVDTP